MREGLRAVYQSSTTLPSIISFSGTSARASDPNSAPQMPTQNVNHHGLRSAGKAGAAGAGGRRQQLGFRQIAGALGREDSSEANFGLATTRRTCLSRSAPAAKTLLRCTIRIHTSHTRALFLQGVGRTVNQMVSSVFEAKDVAYAALLIIPALFVVKILFTYFSDPLDLRKYPAPGFLAAATPLWVLKETWLQRRSRSIHAQHEKLGDVIRIAPNLVVFNTPEAVTDIYGHAAARKLVKDTFYDKVAGDEHDIVNVRDHGDHAQRRKYLSNSFALKTVTDMEPIIRDNFLRLLNRIDSLMTNSTGKPEERTLDIRKWFNYFTLDVIGDMAFGLPMGFVASGCDATSVETPDRQVYRIPSAIDGLHRGVRLSTTLAQFSNLGSVGIAKSLSKCTGWIRRTTGAQDIDDFENLCISQLRGRLEKGTPDRPQKDFMSKILADRDGKERTISFQQLVAESIVFMNAGSETTAAALSSTLYYLLLNPKCLAKLRAEIDANLNPKDDGIVTYETVKDLPYLRACIDEALRLRPPIAYALQRLVASPEGAVIAGHTIKQGTVVAVSPFSVHRHRSLYKNPDDFDPERWFDPEQLANLRKYYIVFSQGPRQCLGRHIAIVELQILISTLARRYDMALVDDEMDFLIYDRFNSNPGPLPIKVIGRRSAV
ncbi:hypothetical protein FOXYS1_10055 [Fusarium oxysporum]|uniref:Benzoate 4-monooxygenase cytochrome P450 n=1 Tax=Fusarium oxysporum TaxID=5507 RepID=A0A8H5A7U5_FUSOX|nr:hypothetical protein FOXYS1_10055 [Fusarium oxysporum]